MTNIADVNWTAVGAISSGVISGLALVVAYLAYRAGNQVRRRTELQVFLQESAYASDRLRHHLFVMHGGEFDRALADVDHDFVERLLPLQSRAVSWPDEPVPRSFDELVAAVDEARQVSRRYAEGRKAFLRRAEAGTATDDDLGERAYQETNAWADKTTTAERLSTKYSDAARAKLAAL